ncbi:AzlD domain-containing protein [Nitrincola sp. MINF-07-Sa-05]|uniref:AzlD domain-containing protein n=1 Tax=Nitrincola salilacus TaxID=3400273 RepID=UPI003917FDB6
MMWLILALMALITFAFRYILFSGYLRLEISPRQQRFLGFSAPCVLTAMATPIVFMPGGELISTMLNPYLLVGLLAIGLSLVTRHMLLTVTISLLVFALATQML